MFKNESEILHNILHRKNYVLLDIHTYLNKAIILVKKYLYALASKKILKKIINAKSLQTFKLQNFGVCSSKSNNLSSPDDFPMVFFKYSVFFFSEKKHVFFLKKKHVFFDVFFGKIALKKNRFFHEKKR